MVGLKLKLYAGDAGDAVTALDEVTICRDVTCNMSTGSAQRATRGSRYRRADLTLSELQLDIELEYVPGDAQYELLRDAWLAQTPVALAALSGPKATVGSEGPYGDFVITNFSRPEPLEDTVIVNITAELHDFDDTGDADPWHETAGGG